MYIEQPLPVGTPAPPDPYIFIGQGPFPRVLQNTEQRHNTLMSIGVPPCAASSAWDSRTCFVGFVKASYYAINSESELAKRHGIQYLEQSIQVTHEF